MRKKVQLLIAALVVALGVSGVVLAPSTAYADAASEVKKGINTLGPGNAASPQEIIQTVVRILLFLIGAISVIMIIVGGFRYVVSQGDSSALTSAKNTILYAIIGLAVAIFAWAIVDFVVTNLAN